jgi:hypothetical protein
MEFRTLSGRRALRGGEGSVQGDGSRRVPGADAEFELTAVIGSEVNGIVSNPFLERAFRTTSYRIHVTINDDGT